MQPRYTKVAKPSTQLEHGGLDFKEGTENSSHYQLNSLDTQLPQRSFSFFLQTYLAKSKQQNLSANFFYQKRCTGLNIYWGKLKVSLKQITGSLALTISLCQQVLSKRSFFAADMNDIWTSIISDDRVSWTPQYCSYKRNQNGKVVIYFFIFGSL